MNCCPTVTNGFRWGLQTVTAQSNDDDEIVATFDDPTNAHDVVDWLLE